MSFWNWCLAERKMAAIINIPPIKSLIDNNSFAKKYEENAAMIISNKKIGLAKTGCILGRPNWIIKVEINNIDPIDKIRNKLYELEIFAILGKLLSINNKKNAPRDTPNQIEKDLTWNERWLYFLANTLVQAKPIPATSA